MGVRSIDPRTWPRFADLGAAAEVESVLWDRLLALFLLLPATLCLWPEPLALLADDPEPALAATGLCALALLPATFALLLCGRRLAVHGSLLLWIFLIHAATTVFLGAPQDPLEAKVSVLRLILIALTFQCGASLGRAGRALFLRALVLISLMASAPALIAAGFDRELGLAGPLGNTGTLSQAALPGALIGARLASLPKVPLFWRAAGVLALLSLMLHSALAPVLTAAVAVAGAGLVSLPLARDKSQRLLGILLAAIGAATFLAAMQMGSEPDANSGTTEAFEAGAAEVEFQRMDQTAPGQPQQSMDAASNSASGGFEVRLRVWKNTWPMLLDNIPFGIGPGQFRTSFPPYRDPLEIEISSVQHSRAGIAEVEHAHNDALEGLLWCAFPGGLAWIAFLLMAAAGALACIRAQTQGRTAAGLAVLGVLISGLAHAPLLANPVAASLVLPLIGALLGEPHKLATRQRAGRGTAWVLAIALGVSTPFAAKLIDHGRALAQRQQLAQELLSDDGGEDSFSPQARQAMQLEFWSEEGRLLRRALSALPDSVLALALDAARGPRDTLGQRRQTRERWESVLDRRPHQVSALINIGLYLESDAERRTTWEQALSLDPGHPLAQANLARLALETGRGGEARAYIEMLRAGGKLDAQLAREFGLREVLQGNTHYGMELLTPVYPDLAVSSPESLFARSLELKDSDSLAASAFEFLAQKMWGIQHLDAGSGPFAVRSFRQALRITMAHVDGGDAPTRLELAAALFVSERAEEAEEQLLGISITAELWSALSPAAQSQLQSQGLAP